jgi:shikimate dehydrogenase
VLGAGGSARAAVWALLDAGARDVFVCGRTAERVRMLTAELGGTAVERPVAADVLVHCTPIGLNAPVAGVKELPLDADLLPRYNCVVDYVYRDGGTALMDAARALSVDFVDGLQLLVGQGRLSFTQFTGIAAPIQAMRDAIDHG